MTIAAVIRQLLFCASHFHVTVIYSPGASMPHQTRHVRSNAASWATRTAEKCGRGVHLLRVSPWWALSPQPVVQWAPSSAQASELPLTSSPSSQRSYGFRPLSPFPLGKKTVRSNEVEISCLKYFILRRDLS